MNIEKAIELNTEAERSLSQGKRYDHANAVHLGIEALKAIQELRDLAKVSVDEPLPGED